MTVRGLRSITVSIASLLMLLMGAVPDTAVIQARVAMAVPEPSGGQTLCILDFNRLGDDAGMDWLEQGLADMMIGTMNRLSPYRVIEREHLRDILREHGFALSGLVGMDTAIRQARIARAELLLLGSFARQHDRLTIQVRVIRMTDQQILAQAVWTDRHANVLAAPQALSEALLAYLQKPVDPAQFEGIEQQVPRTIDVAKAYYRGMGAFDDGRYHDALAHYLDAAQAGDFVKVYPAVLEMYTLLGQSEHAFLYAQTLAQSYEEADDVRSALEYYFAAAQQSLAVLKDPGLAIRPLERLLRLVKRHEQNTGEIARTKRFILDKIDELHATGKYASFEKILTDRSIRYRMWPDDIERELRRRAEEHTRGGYTVLQENTWVKRPIPPPSMFMWKIRALRTLARAYARLGQIEPALDQYQELLAQYAFLIRHPLSDGKQGDPVRTEAHFMMLYHYARTGRLVRDHAVNAINRLNVVKDGGMFRRDFADRSPDPRARVTSRYEGRGYEYFDFAAPLGHQIKAVTLRARVEGIAAFGFSLPHAAGWPPQFSLSRRVTKMKFSQRGTYERTVTFPPGVEFFSVGTSWGPGLYDNTPAEVLRQQRAGPRNAPDIVWWQASFVVSRKKGDVAQKGFDVETLPGAPLQKRIDRYAAGWDRAFVVRQSQTVVYAGNPLLDVYAEDWLVYAMDGDIQIFQRRNPQLAIDIPITINTRELEFDASLVRMHDGRYALLWARGTSKRNARRFVAFSADLLHWETPQRMVFEAVPEKIGYTYTRVEPPERTTNVVSVGGGYAMLLAQGFMRYSEDLRHWGPPKKVIPQDLYRNRLVKTLNGMVWAVYEHTSDERQPYTPDDRLHGYFVVDGKPYRHVTEVRVSRSSDGMDWQPAGKIVFPGQPTGLWAFPIAERQMGIAVAFNNLSVRWLTVSRSHDVRLVDSALQVVHQSEEAAFFVRDASLLCIRPMLNFEGQRPMLLATSSRALYKRFAE